MQSANGLQFPLTELKKVLQIINDEGGDVINVAMTAQQTGKRTYYFRLAVCETEAIKKALEKQVYGSCRHYSYRSFIIS